MFPVERIINFVHDSSALYTKPAEQREYMQIVFDSQLEILRGPVWFRGADCILVSKTNLSNTIESSLYIILGMAAHSMMMWMMMWMTIMMMMMMMITMVMMLLIWLWLYD